jgi:hypothetical protein
MRGGVKMAGDAQAPRRFGTSAEGARSAPGLPVCRDFLSNGGPAQAYFPKSVRGRGNGHARQGENGRRSPAPRRFGTFAEGARSAPGIRVCRDFLSNGGVAQAYFPKSVRGRGNGHARQGENGRRSPAPRRFGTFAEGARSAPGIRVCRDFLSNGGVAQAYFPKSVRGRGNGHARQGENGMIRRPSS